MKKRLIGLVTGLIFAPIYGFWTMLMTGGGHGNFLWVFLFTVTEFYGLLFPLIGFLVVDLRPFWAKVICGVLLSLNLLLTAFLLLGGGGEKFSNDIIKSWDRDQFGFIVVSLVHALPIVVFIIRLLTSIFFPTPDDDEDIDSPTIIKL